MDREHGRERCMKITCNEKALWITKTLHSALLQLRRIIMSKMAAEEQGLKYLETLPEPRSKYVWIDQLSINQQDLA
jgi:late competence protein required for DNA uptake (superfamily II DNA/RNA helicase)